MKTISQKKIFLIFNFFLLPLLPDVNSINLDSVVKIRVLDTPGNSIPNVRISIKKQGDVVFSGLTDSGGIKSIDILAGEYSISLSKPGFYDLKDEELMISESNHIFTYTLKSNKSETRDEHAKDRFKTNTFPMYTESTLAVTAYAATSDSDLPKSGLMTAGEWNDLHNWRLWEDLLSQEEYKDMESFWGINSQNRYSVTVLNNQNIPMANVMVDLVDEKNEILWRGVTDLAGKVELWEKPYGNSPAAAKIIAFYEGKPYQLHTLSRVSQGSNIIYLDASCEKDLLVDIAFVVDATSSMKDEIKYLQSELLDVIRKVENPDKKIRWASLFYRDHNEDYLTRFSDFSNEKNLILDFIGNQTAEGGGDYPEEVSEALHQSVNELNWSKDADAKLLFLILDAPPHDNAESLNKYRHAVKSASSRGIKIIPVTASGINRYTEFLMKFTAIFTNGTYVFITDDSGIGNPHLSPVVSDFEVETLNDIIIRLIDYYSTKVSCGSAIIQSNWKGTIYPNPAAEIMYISQVVQGDFLQMISSSGMVVKSHVVQNENTANFNVSQLTPGTFFVKITRKDEVITRPVLVIR